MGDSRLDQTFRIAVLLKGLDGLLEIVGAGLLWISSRIDLNQLIHSLTQHELSEDPRDWFANHLIGAGQHLSHSSVAFGTVYLLSHGVIKIILVIGLLKRLRWAYPATMTFLALFILYQLYRLALNVTLGLSLLTAFDGLVLGLTWREYQRSFTITKA